MDSCVYVLSLRCSWERVHAEVLVLVSALCCTTPDLWHSDTFQRRLLSRLHNYWAPRADQCTWRGFLSPSRAIYLSLFSACVHLPFLIPSINGCIGVSLYALMSSKNMMDLISYDDWWWWRWGYIITCTYINFSKGDARENVGLKLHPYGSSCLVDVSAPDTRCVITKGGVFD
jgi:hypothetical protein